MHALQGQQSGIVRIPNYIWLRFSCFLGLPDGLFEFHIVSDNTLFVMR